MKLVSWNIEGRLSRFAEKGQRGSPEHILRSIRELDGDILFLPEAYDDIVPVEKSILEGLELLGYEYVDVPYEQTVEGEYAAVVKPHMLLASRYKILRSEIISSVGGIRNMLFADVLDPGSNQTIRIFGIHLDDKSEKSRLAQLEELLPRFNDASSNLMVAMGDFNAMPGSSGQARLLRTKAALLTTRLLPHSRVKTIFERLSDMALGTTWSRIQQSTKLITADPKGRPTTTPKMRGQEWLPSIRLVQIDHIFVSPQFITENFKVSRDNGSDHRAISVSTRQKP